MSVSEQGRSAPINPGSPLARALDGYAVPGLSAGFADRVLAAAEARSLATLPTLPPLRRAPRFGRGWRAGQRIVVGIASFTLVATAAAATGMLERFDIPMPSAGTVWANITGTAPVAAAAVRAPVIAVAKPADEGAVAAPAPVEIVGLIDTPEELGEAFRRIDEVRQGRAAARRELVDQRIEAGIGKAIENRRAAGLPLPTAKEEAAFRAKVIAERARLDQLANDRIAARRAEMERKIENGEALTREDIVRPLQEDRRAFVQRQDQLRQLRAMSPEDRRAALRRLPPEERRALIEEYRARRAAQAAPARETAPESASSPAPTG